MATTSYDNRDLKGIGDYMKNMGDAPPVTNAYSSRSKVSRPGSALASRKSSNLKVSDHGAHHSANRQKTAPDYGARKRMPQSAADKNDRIMDLERENNTLKSKENLLKDEITKM